MPSNMASVKRYEAAAPLLSDGKPQTVTVHYQDEQEDETNDSEPLYIMRRQRHTSMVANDAVILVLEILQILALLQSMSLRWIWPSTWTVHLNFLLLFNLDFWEFFKVSSGDYEGIQNANTASTKMPFSFNYIILAWGLFLLIFAGTLLTVYLCLRYRQNTHLVVHVARMERAMVIVVQVLSLPLGTILFRLFQCTSTGLVDVLNQHRCFQGVHWAYLVPALLLMVALFLVYPIWMIIRIWREVNTCSGTEHERYLRLKELEYLSGLDAIWAVKGFHIFSSFKLHGVYFRPVMHFFKLISVIIYAGGFNNIFAQGTCMAVFLVLLWLHHLILRPFRITSFNVFLGMSYICLIGDAILGAAIAFSSPLVYQSAWLVEPYALYIMAAMNAVLLLVIIVFILHLICYRLCCHKRQGKDPMWPTFASKGPTPVGSHTQKFMMAVLKGKAFLEKCKTINPLFTPVHELSRHIQVVNAYYREAELLGDPMHNTLWNLLDDMVHTHTQLEHQSLLADSVKDSIRTTAEELMELLPAFSKRLAQRDYDFILVEPVKKRLLLKMFIVGMFLGEARKRQPQETAKQQSLGRVWPSLAQDEHLEDEDRYLVELYPEALEGPDAEGLSAAQTTAQHLQLLDIEDDEDTQSLSSALQKVPEMLTFTFNNDRIPTPVSIHTPRSRSSASLQGHDNSGYVPDDLIPGTVPHQEGSRPGETTLTLEGAEMGESNTDLHDLINPPRAGSRSSHSHSGGHSDSRPRSAASSIRPQSAASSGRPGSASSTAKSGSSSSGSAALQGRPASATGRRLPKDRPERVKRSKLASPPEENETDA